MSIKMYINKGWKHFPSVFTKEEIEPILAIGLDMRKTTEEFSTWSGISCAGRFNNDLFDLYTSQKMLDLSKRILGDTVYFFNDQVVIKLPNENFHFEAHYDNQYGPNKENKIHTCNFCVILSDMDKTNGTLEVKNHDTGEWNRLVLKQGDVVAIRGDTYHRSGINTSQSPRGLYACVYTEQPLELKDFYYTEFNKANVVIQETTK